MGHDAEMGSTAPKRPAWEKRVPEDGEADNVSGRLRGLSKLHAGQDSSVGLSQGRASRASGASTSHLLGQLHLTGLRSTRGRRT